VLFGAKRKEKKKERNVTYTIVVVNVASVNVAELVVACDVTYKSANVECRIVYRIDSMLDNVDN